MRVDGGRRELVQVDCGWPRRAATASTRPLH